MTPYWLRASSRLSATRSSGFFNGFHPFGGQRFARLVDWFAVDVRNRALACASGSRLG
jgi:hypothetical protein